MALGSTQPLTEMSTRCISWGVKAAGAWGWQPYHHPVPLSWNLRTLTSWNPVGYSRPVMGLLYLFTSSSEYAHARWLVNNKLETVWKEFDSRVWRKPTERQATRCSGRNSIQGPLKSKRYRLSRRVRNFNQNVSLTPYVSRVHWSCMFC